MTDQPPTPQEIEIERLRAALREIGRRIIAPTAASIERIIANE